MWYYSGQQLAWQIDSEHGLGVTVAKVLDALILHYEHRKMRLSVNAVGSCSNRGGGRIKTAHCNRKRQHEKTTVKIGAANK